MLCAENDILINDRNELLSGSPEIIKKIFYEEEVYGRWMEVDDVLEIILADKRYYGQQGGLTLSGGEPLLQHEFCLELLIRARNSGIHTCIDTSGFSSRKHIERLIPYIDLFLFDYKHSNPTLHLKYTGRSNTLILKNLERILELKKKVILRCPIIPDVNNTHIHFDEIIKLVKTHAGIIEVNILPYHNSYDRKAHSINHESFFTDNLAEKEVDFWYSYLRDRGVKNVSTG